MIEAIRTGTGTPSHTVKDLVVDYIEQNYAHRISLRDVAQAVGYSACHLTTTFREATGTPVTSWIVKRRIIAAQKLLSETNLDLAAACEAVGFGDFRYFRRQFRRQVGLPPGRFRSASRCRLGCAAIRGEAVALTS